MTRKETLRKKFRRWFLGEKNLPPESITENIVKTKFETVNRHKLESVFEDWDDKLQYGVSYQFLMSIWKELGQLKSVGQEDQFLASSGYFRDRNQLSCSVTLSEFFTLLEKLLPTVQKETPEVSETGLVDRIIGIGYNKLKETQDWEFQHALIRKESAREKSVAKDARVTEVMTLLSKNRFKTSQNKI